MEYDIIICNFHSRYWSYMSLLIDRFQDTDQCKSFIIFSVNSIDLHNDGHIKLKYVGVIANLIVIDKPVMYMDGLIFKCDNCIYL
jgi:hypothetical protein